MRFDKRFLLLAGLVFVLAEVRTVSAQSTTKVQKAVNAQSKANNQIPNAQTSDRTGKPQSAATNHGVTVIKPGDKGRFDAYSLSEWLFTSAGWAFTTYDNVVFQPAPHHQNWRGTRGIDVFINGIQLQSDWLQHSYMHMLEFSPQIIDSVVVYPPGSFVRNRMSVSGALDVYLSDEYLVKVSGRTSNQVNDFGPINQEGVSYNIERVKESAEVFLNLGSGRYKTQILGNISTYSYSNVIYYDRETYTQLVRRRPDDEPGEWGYQTPLSLLQTHQYVTPGAIYRAMTSFSYHTNNFLWDDWSGNEIAGRYRKYTISASREAVAPNGLHAGVSYAFANSTPIRDDHQYLYDVDQHGFQANVEYEFQLQNRASLSLGAVSDTRFYESHVGQETLQSTENYGTASYRSGLFQADVALGPNRGGAGLRWSRNNLFAVLNYQHDTSDHLSEIMPRLDTGFGIRGTNNEATMQINDRLEMQYLSQIVGFSASSSAIREYGITLNHTWFRKLPHREARFRHPDPGVTDYPLISDFTYRTLEDVGRLQISGSMRSVWQNLSASTSFSLSVFTWGEDLYKNEVKRYPSVVFRQNLRYDLHPTFTINASYNFESERDFAEFVSADASVELWPPSKTRAVHNVSIGFEQRLVQDRVSLNLILRNLLSSTETYQPNGLYYNLSMIIGVRVRL
ncbi:MAG: hypothetical protein LAT57_12445 [Balneolales bacterium]|nr:hypothetical protein [Balneolales bacterium]